MALTTRRDRPALPAGLAGGDERLVPWTEAPPRLRPHRPPAVSAEAASANGRVVLTAWPPERDPAVEAATFPTRDPADQAHRSRGADGRLLPAGQVPDAVPRRYPACAFNARGQTDEQLLDELAERHARLSRELDTRGRQLSSLGAIRNETQPPERLRKVLDRQRAEEGQWTIELQLLTEWVRACPTDAGTRCDRRRELLFRAWRSARRSLSLRPASPSICSDGPAATSSRPSASRRVSCWPAR